MELPDQSGKTPLMYAVENGLVENVSVLLNKQVCKLVLFCFPGTQRISYNFYGIYKL